MRLAMLALAALLTVVSLVTDSEQSPMHAAFTLAGLTSVGLCPADMPGGIGFCD